jgi:hypothetical protein
MSVPNKDEIYAAHLYPPEAIPVLFQARAWMRQARQLLDQLLEEGKIDYGDPAGDAWDRLDQAINMLEPGEGDESDSDEVAKPKAPHLVVDNT